jgi:hypothetical protein
MRSGAQIAAHSSADEGFLLGAGAATAAAFGAAGLGLALRRINYANPPA